jgi:hypothetical protein
MFAFFMWMIYAAMPKPKSDLRFSFAETLETFRKDFGTSRDADLLPPVPLSVPPVKPPISLPFFSPLDRLVANGPLPVSGLPLEPVRLAFAGKWFKNYAMSTAKADKLRVVSLTNDYSRFSTFGSTTIEGLVLRLSWISLK